LDDFLITVEEFGCLEESRTTKLLKFDDASRYAGGAVDELLSVFFV
jgi:hypothetical protein